jgi:hypothetical protein
VNATEVSVPAATLPRTARWISSTFVQCCPVPFCAWNPNPGPGVSSSGGVNV